MDWSGIEFPNMTGFDLTNVLTWVYALAGITAVVFILYSAVTILLSNGDAGKVAKGKRSLLYAIAGLVIVIIAALITSFVKGAVNG